MMLCTDADVEPTVISATAGRMRVHAGGLRRDQARATVTEEMVATVSGVRAVRAYPRTASVVVWFVAGACDTAAVLSAIVNAQGVPADSAMSGGVAPVRTDVIGNVVGGLAQRLLRTPRHAEEVPPELVRLRAALTNLGYQLPPATISQRSSRERTTRGVLRARAPWILLALPLGWVAFTLAGPGVVLIARRVATRGFPVRPARRPAASVAGMAVSALAVPSWGGVAVSLLLVTVAGAVAYRQRLGLTRELVVAAGRAAVQLVAAGTLLRMLFQRTNLLGAAGWLISMTVIAGQVAGRRSPGLPGARVAATAGVGAGTVVTLGGLLAGRVITAQARVIVPVGGMIVSSAMLAAGSVLRRLDADVRQSRPAIEARLALGLSGRQAILPYRQSALRNALIPAIDSTKVVGLISLPGAMTGLILAGISPLAAIRYQIVVMYMQLAGTALAALVTVRVAEESIFDDAHRLMVMNAIDEST